jgi:hypothetical protein
VPTGHTRLWRRGAVYHFRCKIPGDLLGHYAPRIEIKFSLKTTDRREAERRVRLESVKLDQEFAALRRNGTAASADPAPKALTDELIGEMASEWAGQILRGDEAVRIQGLNDTAFADRVTEYDQMERLLREAVSRGKLTEFEVESALVVRGIKMPRKDTEDYQQLLYAYNKVGFDVVQKLKARHRGEPVESPKAPSPADNTAGAVTLDGVLKRWAAERKPPGKTLEDWERAVRRFAAVHGEALPVVQINGAMWPDSRMHSSDGKAVKTTEKYLAAVSALLEWAVGADLIEVNPGEV